jgi:hypothetical protein
MRRRRTAYAGGPASAVRMRWSAVMVKFRAGDAVASESCFRFVSVMLARA